MTVGAVVLFLSEINAKIQHKTKDPVGAEQPGEAVPTAEGSMSPPVPHTERSCVHTCVLADRVLVFST